MAAILIIDDEDKYLDLCRRHMPEHDFMGPARNHREARALLDAHRDELDLVLLDVHFDIPVEDLIANPAADSALRHDNPRLIERMRRTQGLRILDEIRPLFPGLPVIVMTSRDDLPIEADSHRLNAEDYTYLLDDEYLDARSLKLQIDGILARSRQSVRDDEPFYWGVTSSMAAIKRRVAILSRGQLPVIIQGATGTGKSLLAREFIHPRSARSGPFVAVDLSTIPNDLMAAHLFGVVKGAFTGATHSRDGVLARADGGTLFLDEIGNLSHDLQKSLLLVLQERRYRPVGAVDERSIDLKLVVATNEDLAQMVRQGRFREDLYMRLNPATAVTLPSLSERRDDFDVLLSTFVQRVCSTGYNRDLLEAYAASRGLSGQSKDDPIRVAIGRKMPLRFDRSRLYFLLHANSFRFLEEFPWPGNFRQFEMLLSNLVTFTLVELVDRADLEPQKFGAEARPDVVPVPARTVAELMRPFDDAAMGVASATRTNGKGGATEGASVCTVRIEAAESLNAVSCEVERQYLEWAYQQARGDLGRVAELLLGDESAGRKVQLRMNQLGVKLRDLKRERRGGR